ncbi:hypothetical protein BVC80_1835g176 [Macleaya cordata]|uniref:BPM/SPOP BACK domain-containing protein n=1 Tax=Macleaya cordata TaxID=56857 RepID=A0A200R506_MACCD|nr:hypothetical protein BVC80_1835g176 [Macleaya cordata]
MFSASLKFFRSYAFYVLHAAVMQSEGFGYLEESCPSLLSELLETIAVVDEESSLLLSRKRNGSNNNIGLNLVADGPLLDPNGRRMRRRL